MEFKQEENILEQSLKDFENNNRILGLWITLKIRIKLIYLNLINKQQQLLTLYIVIYCYLTIKKTKNYV